MHRVKIIIPSYNSKYIEAQTSILDKEKIIVIDSESNDGSRNAWLSFGVVPKVIPKESFNHGGTRNLGAQIAQKGEVDILIFLTQDAIPQNNEWIKNLVQPILDGMAEATFARQVPRESASDLERFSRYFNYPSVSRRHDASDINTAGVKAFFFSNVCSAVRADIFWELGGFPENVIMNEDMLFAAKLLRAGYTIEYVADAEVIHSHDYTLTQQFKRNFDVGAFFADAGPLLDGAKVGGEGLRFVREQFRYVLRLGKPTLIPLVIAEAAAKYSGFQLGKHHRWLPKAFKKKFSMHSYHWDQKENS